MSYADRRTVIAALVNSNWTTTPVHWPGENRTPPAKTQSKTAPAAFIEVVFESIAAERVTPVWSQFDEAMELRYYEESIGQGENLMLQRIDELETFINSGDISSPPIYWMQPFMEPGTVDYGDEWNVATLRCPYIRFRDSSTTTELILAGQGSTQMTITQASHGFAAKDWIGDASGAWEKAIADGLGALATGVVSSVIDADTFVLTTIGNVKLTTHGWGSTPAPLYLSQTVAGAATLTDPTTRLSQQIATVADADRIIVNQYVAVDKG